MPSDLDPQLEFGVVHYSYYLGLSDWPHVFLG